MANSVRQHSTHRRPEIQDAQGSQGLGEYGASALFGVSDKVRNGYEDVVHQHARDGWRLVEIFAPGVAAFGAAKYYELIFERERAEDATVPTGAGRERVASTAGP